MSRRNEPKLDLNLNPLSPRLNRLLVESPTRSLTALSPTSPTSSVSSELKRREESPTSGEEPTTSMMLVGCTKCLMYMMLPEEDPRCPKCKSTVLLDVANDNRKTNKS